MADEHAKICCMFLDPDAGHAVDNISLECLITTESLRHEDRICRCQKCGAFVLYRHVETTFYSGWDNADVDEYYYPIEDPTVGGVLNFFPEKIHMIRGAKHLQRMYREEECDQDRNWFFSKV